jgi:hypothetical protein
MRAKVEAEFDIAAEVDKLAGLFGGLCCAARDQAVLRSPTD